jgi:hypothetical protein
MAMKDGTREDRRQIRYPLHTEAVIERMSGEKLAASTVNVSGGGVLLQLAEQSDLQLGETVTCGVKLYKQKPPQPWGNGRIVRVEEYLVAIDFQDGIPRPNSR